MACQLLSAVERHECLPPSYVRPEQQRPRLGDVVGDLHVPLIDLRRREKSRKIIKQIADACGSYGIFQIVNHGVSEESMQQMLGIADEFFRLPVEEKMRLYSDDPSKKLRLSTSFNVRKETYRNWRDYLRLHCYPPEEYAPDWPSNPPLFKSVVSSYSREVRKLGLWLLGGISEGLGLEEEYLLTALGEQEQHMAINHYPLCPAPELTYGLQAHADPNALTILLQEPEVGGLQILKDGRWFGVDSTPNALVVNVGDQLEVLSNGRYKSVWHRVVANLEKSRTSVASFLCPSPETLVGPAKKLTANGFQALYRNYTYGEYYKKFWARNLDQEHCLEFFKY